MKAKNIANQYGFNETQFIAYLQNETNFKSGIGGYNIPDEQVASVAKAFQTKLTADAEATEQQKLEKQKKMKALSEMLITSGFSFEGYRIVKYSGYISGDDVVQIPRELKFFAGVSGSSAVGEELTNALVKIRRHALTELKEAAYNLGCNAIIGVDFDYITLEPETSNIGGHTAYLPFVFCVTANGNAVVIEKIE